LKKIKNTKRKKGITRRDFMKYSAGTGLLMGMPALHAFGGHRYKGDKPSKKTEKRTYYFNLSHADMDADHYLIAGSVAHKLEVVTPEVLKIAKSQNRFLNYVPDDAITHHASKIRLPADAIQLCHVKSKNKGDAYGSWSMPLMFFHLPRKALKNTWKLQPVGEPHTSGKLKFYDNHSQSPGSSFQDYLDENDLKDVFETAKTLVFHHPEMLCGDANSATYIQNTIIGKQSSTTALAISLSVQGTPSETGGWANLEPYINPETGLPYLNSKGEKQYFHRWSDRTHADTGNAVMPSLEQAKDDPILGVNITNLDPTQDNHEMQGTIWRVFDGVTTVDASTSIGDGAYDYTLTNKSRDHGYQASITKVEPERIVTFKVRNWYARYLGIYVRFLDAADEPILVKDLPTTITDYFPSWGKDFDNGDYDNFALLLGPELELLGIPIEHAEEEFKFQMPETASKALILAGGAGVGSANTYPKTLGPGSICTMVVNLAIPGFFLIFGMATGFAQFYKDMKAAEYVQLIGNLAAEAAVDSFVVKSYRDYKVLIEVAKTFGEFLLSKGAGWLTEKISGEIAHSVDEVTDAVPGLGMMLQAIAALGLVAEIIETCSELAVSPRTYVNKLTFTHNIEVTIYPDENDPVFPEVADYYELTALFDNGTPHTSGKIAMPDPSPESLSYTFSGVPYGGKVNISVGFHADTDNWLAGMGSTGCIDNTAGSVAITIKENLVPLTSNTQYSHKDKIVLDENGNHIWQPTTTRPEETEYDLSCGGSAGELCELTGITVSEHYGALGYSWKSFSKGIGSCDSGASGQLHQFASLSFTDNPEKGYLCSACGLSAPVRVVYDLKGSNNNNYYLDTTQGRNIIRQIRLQLDGKPDWDAPNSNIAWGKFNHSSDAFLLHPGGKLVSINAETHKVEVLDLPDSPMTDDEAHLAQSYSGPGTREGLLKGPVAAAITHKGALLILESENRRIQAFDVGINPTPYFQGGNYHVPLWEETQSVMYLDMAVEHTGFIYVLSYVLETFEYRLDIYTPEGDFLSRTTGVNAARCTVDLWRNVYTLNYEVLTLLNQTVPSITEPSTSRWKPSVP
jgi:hypothetical protein